MTKLKITESSWLEKVQLFKPMLNNIKTIILQSQTKQKKLKEIDYFYITFSSVLMSNNILKVKKFYVWDGISNLT